MVEITIVRIDDCETKIVGLPIESVYNNIGRQMDTSHINQYLRSVCSYEKETLDVVRDMKNEDIWSNFILRDHLLAKGCRKKEPVINITIGYTQEILEDLRSIIDSDDDFLKKVKDYTNLRAHILTDDGMYVGHLYTWEYEDILFVDAIRSSTQNILDRSRGEGVKGVIAMLVDSCIKMARLVDVDVVRVRDPYSVTKHVLSTMDFNKGNHYSFPVERTIPPKVPKYRLIISAE